MRGQDGRPKGTFGYPRLKERVPEGQVLRAKLALVDEGLAGFNGLLMICLLRLSQGSSIRP